MTKTWRDWLWKWWIRINFLTDPLPGEEFNPFSSTQVVRMWLTGNRRYIADPKEQDLDTILESSLSVDDLMSLFRVPESIPERRVHVALALLKSLDFRLNPDPLDSDPTPYNPIETDRLEAFVRLHISDLNSMDLGHHYYHDILQKRTTDQ